MLNENHIFLLEEFLSYMQVPHNLYLSTMHAKNLNTFSVPLYPAYTHERDNPTHQLKLQMDILYKKIHPS